MFEVKRHIQYNMVEATLAGFFDTESAGQYFAEVEPLIAKAAQISGGYRMLLDVSGCAIQSQDIMMLFGEHLARVPRSRACAVVTGNAAVRLQARRLMVASTFQTFATRADAIAWLLSVDTRAVA